MSLGVERKKEYKVIVVMRELKPTEKKEWSNEIISEKKEKNNEGKKE